MNAQITVVSLGPGSPEWMTLQTADALQSARKLVLRTSRHPAVQYLKEKGIAFTSLDALYDRYEDFDELHRAMADTLWKAAMDGPVTYAVMDSSNDASVAALQHSAPQGAVLRCLPGLSRADCCLAAAPGLAAQGARIVPAICCESAGHHPGLPLLVTEIDNAALAGDVKLWLTDLYDDEMEVTFFPSTVDAPREAVRIPLWALDRQGAYDHTVAVLVPASPISERKRFCFDDLLRVMDMLRGEDGCPWDRAQTHESLRPYLLEEAWETAAAIDEGDADHLADELGDVLLQVVFHAHVGKCHGTFTISDVTTAICHKMIYRHAHIFGSAHCENAEEVSQNWEKLKKAEKGLRSQTDVMRDVPAALPSLMRACKVQKKAAQVGFDWDDAHGALPKVHEEADEVLAELDAGRDPGEELGDLLFACVNAARLCGKDPEQTLHQATEKFIRRFAAMEKRIISDGKSLEALTLAEMDVYWNQVKQAAHNGQA